MSRCRACKGQTYWVHPNDPDNCGCGPTAEPKLDLSPHDYDYDEDDDEWSKCISSVRRVARRDHKSGEVMKGERYTEVVFRFICDKTSKQKVERSVRKGW